jgi:hypothetical protein
MAAPFFKPCHLKLSIQLHYFNSRIGGKKIKVRKGERRWINEDVNQGLQFEFKETFSTSKIYKSFSGVTLITSL